MITIDAPITICLECGGKDLQFIVEEEEMQVGSEGITINLEYFRCMNCGDEIEVSHPDYHPVADAYDEYERRTGERWRNT